jgi:hypothetical protein
VKDKQVKCKEIYELPELSLILVKVKFSKSGVVKEYGTLKMTSCAVWLP